MLSLSEAFPALKGGACGEHAVKGQSTIINYQLSIKKPLLTEGLFINVFLINN